MSKNALVPFDDRRVVVREVIQNRRHLTVTNEPILNDANIAAYATLKEGLMDLTPKQVSFLGNMTKAGSISAKQCKYLSDLFELHVGLPLNGETLDEFRAAAE